MLILTATAIGMLAVGTRSVLGCMICGFLIVAAFGFAALLGAGAVSWVSLLLALLGYNAGIASVIGLSLLPGIRRHA